MNISVNANEVLVRIDVGDRAVVAVVLVID